MTENKPNYNDNQGNYSNTYGQPQYPANYAYRSTNDLYEEDSSGTGSFIAGAVIGGLIGAATALFLAPKSGREMREDLSSQATQLKEKSIELSGTAKDKVGEYSSTAKDKIEEFSTAAKDYTSDFADSTKEKAEAFTTAAKEKTDAFTSAAKEKSSDLSDSVKEHSDELVDKAKSAAGKANIPMDDGTASTKGEESTDFKSAKENNEKSGDLSKVKNVLENHNAEVENSTDSTNKNNDHNKSNDHNKKDNSNKTNNQNQNHNKK